MPSMGEPCSSTPRPLSAYCLYAPSGFSLSSFEHHPAPPRPRTAVKSHYRPFSTIYEDPTSQPHPSPSSSKSSTFSRRRRPTSSGGLPAFATMVGLGFMKDRTKDKSDKEQPRRNVGETKGERPTLPARPKTSPAVQKSARPSTAPDQTRVGPHLLRKRQSMASLRTVETIVPSSSSQPTTPPPQDSSSNTPTAPILVVKEERDSHATLKGRYEPRDNWSTKWNMKLHPYSADAPYPQAYNPILLENDRYTDILLRRLNFNGSPSFYNYGNAPPKSALDLGCGPGYWAIDAATVWKGCNITIFDLVDVTLPEVHSLENITFVRGNFLRGPLPFADNSFEFVRMVNLSLCIPHKEWAVVLSEVHRVLAVGGRIELIDDQIIFPYGPTPIAIESVTTPPRSVKRVSVLLDDFEEDLLDDDSSLNSGDTESFFTSDENTTSSSCAGKQAGGPEPSVLPFLETPMFKNLATLDPEIMSVARPIKLSPQARIDQWQQRASLSRGLERRFEEIMKNKAHFIEPRPSDFLAEFLKSIFGPVDKPHTFQVKLAPFDMESKGSRSSIIVGKQPDTAEDSKDGQLIVTLDSSVPSKRNWPSMKDKKEKKEKKDKKEKEAGVKGDSGRKEKKKTKENRKSIIAQTESPPAVSAKAAARLGISYSLLAEEKIKMESEIVDVPKSDSSSPPPRVSAKAAKNLGLSYAGLAAATAESIRRRQPLADISSPTQSPGIVVLPSRYIPIPPLELEMHACKYLHTLLSCKAAFVEWAESLRDANGGKLVGDQDLDEILWDYECFRRARFNWPADPPQWEVDDDLFDSESWVIPTPRSATFRQTDSNISSQAYNVIDDARYDYDSFTHLRTIRVYHATKSSNNFPTSSNRGNT